MKRVFVFLVLVLCLPTLQTIAQTGINFKAVIRGEDGNVLSDKSVGVRFTILESGITSVYRESHMPLTDANGILILHIGQGNPELGDFSSLDWGGYSHLLRTELDLGEGWMDMGTTEFQKVPYAFSAGVAEVLISDEVEDADADPFNEIQFLTLSGDILSLSDGGSVILYPDPYISGQYYYADEDGDGFGDVLNPVFVPDGEAPPVGFVLVYEPL